jgi:hypothetical protein
VISPVRLPGAIGEGKGCAVFVMERWSSRATLIWLELNRERRAELTGEGRDDGVELDWVRGRKMEWLRPGAVK